MKRIVRWNNSSPFSSLLTLGGYGSCLEGACLSVCPSVTTFSFSALN